MAYATQNPVEPNGSADPRDLRDNAQGLDKFVNGAELTWPDRTGMPRKSLKGLENDVTQFLIRSGFEAEYIIYAPGATIDRATQLVQRSGELFRVKNQNDLPLILSGAWVSDKDKLFSAGDYPLRQDLISDDGSGRVGDASYPNVGQGLAALKRLSFYPGQHFSSYNGGQLNRLQKALTNPLMQKVCIVGLGDSVMWGMTAGGIAPIVPRSGLLSDTRNNGSSPTWFNRLHKWLGTEYYESTTAEEVAWPGSAGGVAQFTYRKAVDLFPGMSPFVAVGSFAQLAVEGSTLGVIWFVNMASSGGGPHSFTWTMTGESFNLRFGATPEGAAYKVYIDGVLQGSFDTSTVDMGVPTGFGYNRTHNFTFRKNAVIKVEAVGGNVARSTLRIESVRINRELRVTNNGIIGTDSGRIYSLLMNDAVRSDDMICLIGPGINDSALPGAYGSPASQSTLSKNLGMIIDSLGSRGIEAVLICPNEVLDNDVRKYTLGQVRSAITSVAIDRKIDVIDQYALTKRLEMDGVKYLDDNVHPDDYGHGLKYENVKNAISSSVHYELSSESVEVVSGYTITKFSNGAMSVIGPAGSTPTVAANGLYNGSITIPVTFASPGSTAAALTAIPAASFDIYGAPPAYLETGSLVQYIIRNGATSQSFNLRICIWGRWI